MDSRTKVFRAHRALAWFYAVFGVALSAAVFLGSGERVSLDILIVPLLSAGVFAAHYFTARACREGRPGGRLASIVLACFMLLGFPIGTIIGIYLLANTWRPWTAGPTAA